MLQMSQAGLLYLSRWSHFCRTANRQISPPQGRAGAPAPGSEERPHVILLQNAWTERGALEEGSAPALAQVGTISPVYDLDREPGVVLMHHREVLESPFPQNDLA